jgi:hypothetical protein
MKKLIPALMALTILCGCHCHNSKHHGKGSHKMEVKHKKEHHALEAKHHKEHAKEEHEGKNSAHKGHMKHKK